MAQPQLRWPIPGTLCGAALSFVSAGTVLVACRSTGPPTTDVTDAAAPAQRDATALEQDAALTEQRPAPTQDDQAPKVPAPPTKLHRIGETASTDDYRFRVEHIKHCETEPYFRPRPGNVKLGVEVKVDSTAATAVMINPFYAWVRDSHGRSYYFTLAGCEPTLRATRLEPEETAAGWLTFEVPESANDLELSYGPPTAKGAPPQVRFSLRRD
ncbi:MAG: DUF4352 domain-containing protein [Polyangiaceae bacterium]|nr:DUF4352 domain-containing protein [Polyangiaceae bacterium]